MDSKIAIKELKALNKIIKKQEGPRLAAEGWSKDWQVLISIILSAQSRDSKTIPVCEQLFKKYKSPKSLGNAPLAEIEKQIKSLNYYKTKAKRIKETAKIISEKGIGETLEELTELPGVGRKTANVYLVAVKGEQAIGVDTHVNRLANKLGWTESKNPHKVEKDLEKLFPRKYWASINQILVTFGQTIGRSRKKENVLLEEIKVVN
jgi:endonuclease-3